MDNYTRAQMSTLLGLPLSTLRYILKTLQIDPIQVKKNSYNRPLYLYSKQQLDLIAQYIIQAAQPRKTCYHCHNKFYQQQMVGTKCIKCYVQYQLLSILYGRTPWKKAIKMDLVKQAYNKLKVILFPKSKESSDSSSCASSCASCKE